MSDRLTRSCEAEAIFSWSAVYTRHQHEKIVAQMLTAKGIETFVPLYESIRRWKDRRKLLSLPLFPGYVFVRGAMEKRLQVVATPGIHMILCQGGRIATIPEQEIQAIRRSVDSNSLVEPHPFLKCGDRVRVTRGALSGVEGFLVRKKNVFRLVLSVDLLAQSVAVEVDAADVEPLHNQAAAGYLPHRTDIRPPTEIPSKWNLVRAVPQSPARVLV